MLLDTGAQVSLINKNVIENQSLINTRNKITISSIHGSENTLGEISATIEKDDTNIPVQFQVTENAFLKEDGILGYDFIGEKAIIHGPNKTLIINSDYTETKFPIKPQDLNFQINQITLENTIQALHDIEYVKFNEIHPAYEDSLKTVQLITHEIDENRIQIRPRN